MRIILVALLALSIPCGVVFRVMQLLYAIDYETGFYKEWHFSLPALDITLFTAAALTLVLALFLKRVPLSAGFSKGCFGVSFLSFLCAAGLAGQLILQMIQESNWSVLMLVSTALSIICIISFVALGIRQDQALPGSGAFLFRNIVLTLWCCSEMLLVFFDHSSESNTSEYVLVILFLYFASLFFVKYGKLAFYNGLTCATTFSLLVSGSLMALFGFVLSVPNLVASCYGVTSWQSFSPFSCIAFPLAVYGLVFVCMNCLRSDSKKQLHI
jgi:hypothetical protein